MAWESVKVGEELCLLIQLPGESWKSRKWKKDVDVRSMIGGYHLRRYDDGKF